MRPSAMRSEKAVERSVEDAAARRHAAASWRDFGAVILVPDFDKAVPLANRIAPEQLELATADPGRDGSRDPQCGGDLQSAGTARSHRR